MRRGIGLGALGGVLAHPFVLYVLFVQAYLSGKDSALHLGNPTNPLLDIVSATLSRRHCLGAVGAVMTILFTGWITAPIGAVAGGMITLLQVESGCQDSWRAALASQQAHEAPQALPIWSWRRPLMR